jgi:hypothetical protein
VSVGLIFFEFNATGAIGTGGVSASTLLTKQTIFAVKDRRSNTALAVANPGAGSAVITFQLLDLTGVQITAPVTRTVAANNHTAFFISELFPNVTFSVNGTLRITSDKAIVTTALLFQDATFGAFPVIPLQ